MAQTFVRFGVAGPALAVALLASCSDPTGPTTGVLEVQGMSLDELGRQVQGGGAARVEITLRPGSQVAQRVAVKTGDELGEEERLLGLITGIAVEGDQGTLTLAYGAEVTFDVETGFGGIHGDELGFEQFVGHVTEALALGREPRVKAVRRPGDAPQAPDDSFFRAALVRLTDDPVPSLIALNVDRDNLTLVDHPPPDAILTVLGLALEIRVSEGLTELILDRDERHEVAFEGVVRAVRADAGAFLLVHEEREIVVRVVDATRMAFNDEAIETLDPVARALEAGLTVVARGEGVVREGEDGILAIVVRFKVREGDRETVTFGGRVRELDADAGLLHLVEGPTVLIGAETHLKVNGEPLESLERIAAALEAGLPVHAFGEGVVESGSDVIHAIFVRFVVDGGEPDRVEFAGRVGAVDLVAGTLQLVEGPTIKITGETTFAEGSALHGLGGVAEALAANLFVFVEGCGTVASEEPRVIAAAVVKFRVED